MLNLRMAQIKVNEIQNQYFREVNGNPVKWNEIYNTESELLEDIKKIHIPTGSDRDYMGRLYKGYEYIHTFAWVLQNGKTLSEKQIIQAKRLALEIKKASVIANLYSV